MKPKPNALDIRGTPGIDSSAYSNQDLSPFPRGISATDIGVNEIGMELENNLNTGTSGLRQLPQVSSFILRLYHNVIIYLS